MHGLVLSLSIYGSLQIGWMTYQALLMALKGTFGINQCLIYSLSIFKYYLWVNIGTSFLIATF